MAERVAVFDMVNVNTRQRINHAHIMDDVITLHWHEPDFEPEGSEGVSISKEDWMKIMTSVYWKKNETLEFSGSEATNLMAADVNVGYVVLRFRQGKKTAEEEVSVLSLRQVDGRLRKRHR
jgi:hypothetical protein